MPLTTAKQLQAGRTAAAAQADSSLPPEGEAAEVDGGAEANSSVRVTHISSRSLAVAGDEAGEGAVEARRGR